MRAMDSFLKCRISSGAPEDLSRVYVWKMYIYVCVYIYTYTDINFVSDFCKAVKLRKQTLNPTPIQSKPSPIPGMSEQV